MKKILRKLSPLLPERKLKNKLRCLRNNILTKNEFKVTQDKDKFKFKFNNKVSFSCFIDIGGGTLIEEARIISKAYLKYYNLNKSDIVIDCGAHIGMFSLYASQKIGNKGKVIAFEPDEENYEKLLKNIKLNNIKNIIVLKQGVWNKKTKLSFDSSLGASSSVSKEKLGEKISVDSIDNFVKKLKLKKVDFIKMDIEGAEIEAIKGAKQTLKNNNVNLAIASYHIRDGKKTYKELGKILKKYKYKIKIGFPNHLTTFAKP